MPIRLSRYAAAFAAACLLLAAAGRAAAQPCCVSTGSADFALVGRYEKAVVATMLSYEYATGRYDTDAEYQRLDSVVARDLVWTIGGGIRPIAAFSAWQVYAAVPMREQYRKLEGLPAARSYCVGDASAGTRVTLTEDNLNGVDRGAPEDFIPFLDLGFGVKFPTGRPPDESEEPTGSDQMGDGAWEYAPGITLTKFITSAHALTLDYAYGHRPERTIPSSGEGVPDQRFDPGDAQTAKASWLFIPHARWSVGVNSSWRITAPARMNGDEVPDSMTFRWRVGASGMWIFSYPFWDVRLAVAGDPWWKGAGFNLPFVGPTLSLQLRRNFR